MTEQEKSLLMKAAKRFPAPRSFDIGDCPNPERAREIWTSLAARGYARISDNARCLFEIIPGEFVSLTESGTDCAKAAEASKAA